MGRTGSCSVMINAADLPFSFILEFVESMLSFDESAIWFHVALE